MATTRFQSVLRGTPEQLLQRLLRVPSATEVEPAERTGVLARALGLTSAELVVGVGFNPSVRGATDIAELLGHASYEALSAERDRLFVTDVYQELNLETLQTLYATAALDEQMLAQMQPLLVRRLATIEERIERRISAPTIERYRKEVRLMYKEGVAQVDFAETRLAATDSGFRALVNEVVIMAECRTVPVGDLFFRDTVLPQERRKLIAHGLVPATLIEERLADPGLDARERGMLEDALRRLSAGPSADGASRNR